MNDHHVQFFTATIFKWKHLLKPAKYKQIIIDSFYYLTEKGKCSIYGFVIMPNHIHVIWKINDGYKRADVQRDFLKFTGQQIKFDLIDNYPDFLEKFRVDLKDRQYQFWQRNPLSIDLYSCRTIEQKLEYLHLNPLQERWDLVTSPEDYYFSSASFYETDHSDFSFLKHYGDEC
ncbi:MAG: transposase [Bacteroidota bacterium]